MPDVSVVIPTRDRPELLAQALRSVLTQEGVTMEVVVVDDGDQETATRVAASSSDARVRVLRTSTRGVSGARNLGVGSATGNWIAFLDDDDVWAPEKLMRQLEAAESIGTGWVYAGDVTVDAELRVIAGAAPPPPQQVVDALARHNAVPAGASNVMVRRDALALAGPFDPTLTTSEDWDMWIRLASAGPPACVPQPLVAVRRHARMASRALDRMLADVETVARRHAFPVDRVRHERWAAWMCLEDGRRAAAIRHYGRAVLAGDIGSIARAFVAVVHPGPAQSAVVADDWTRQAERWLEPLRAAIVNEHTGQDRADA
jgi:glycosyltransferase involved in cell wall biosynthesis